MGDVVRGPWPGAGDVPADDPWPPNGFRTGRPLPTDHPAAREALNRISGRPRSTAWAVTPESTPLHCLDCGRVFARGHVPATGPLVCRDCRRDAEIIATATLFGGDDDT